MTVRHSIEQRKTALASISAALARQWFGYVIFSQNWRDSWIIKGLQMHVAYELADIAYPELEMNSAFVADLTYEAMYEDAHADTLPLESSELLFDESQIRNHLNGVMKNKAPAIMRMLKLVLGDANDYIQLSAAALFNVRSLQPINKLTFLDSVNSGWMLSGDGIIENLRDFLQPWIENSGYPVLYVTNTNMANRVIVTQERFSYSPKPNVIFPIPLSFTTRANPNFQNTYPERILDSDVALIDVNILHPEDDWIIFNIQGQGYYRVNYDANLWEKIVRALQDPEQRNVIHPLNRAVLVDDALNLARAGHLSYEIALRVAMTMQHETHYAVWKAFIRNMDFIRKRLVALDRDNHIYMRVVRRIITAVERDIGFYPESDYNHEECDEVSCDRPEDAMVSLTRGLVMEHACRALYGPCTAAAAHWFWNGDQLNRNIPTDLRPAVYCTMVREGGAEVRELLWQLYSVEDSHYERVVILKAMTCSRDNAFILTLLTETLAYTARYGIAERSVILKALAESSSHNAGLALHLITTDMDNIRTWYGGVEKIEEMLASISENLVDHQLTDEFTTWATNFLVAGQDYADTALRAAAHARENIVWVDSHLETVYEWIDGNLVSEESDENLSEETDENLSEETDENLSEETDENLSEETDESHETNETEESDENGNGDAASIQSSAALMLFTFIAAFFNK